ncbi:expressed unknown protein [Seminavis robusta]|uniref:Sulfotransferase n=1 Tax=Seminavis robusta TaxID=568900 RepID=A0A9N8ET92_9STRA|nr:expressed unknown protein [Seminavis robusta]|eukprot:Sro1810_g299121.1  (375) ;mRNA; r:8220-9344
MTLSDLSTHHNGKPTQEQSTTSSAQSVKQLTVCTLEEMRRVCVLVCTHFLSALLVLLACYRWKDLLPSYESEGSLWSRSKLSNGTASSVSTTSTATTTFTPTFPPASSSKELDFSAPSLFDPSTVNRVYWMHVPKTGGSIFVAFFFQFCPETLAAERAAIVPGQQINKDHLYDMWLLRHYAPEKWCNNHLTFYNMPCPGCHYPYEERPNEEFFSMTMFRDPTERLWSAYRYGHHGSWQHDSNSTFDEYIREPNIMNCQLKMVLGHHCYKQHRQEIEHMGPLDVSLAIERVSQPRFFFGITERWAESLCLFHRWFGGSVIEDIEFVNNRKGRTQPPGNYRDVVPPHKELEWFEGIMPIFEERLKAANCLGYSPPP